MDHLKSKIRKSEHDTQIPCRVKSKNNLGPRDPINGSMGYRGGGV